MSLQIDPDVDEDRGKGPERKKLKLKEVHLTKLLSTKVRHCFLKVGLFFFPPLQINHRKPRCVSVSFKVAVHSFVENLFRSIWGLPNCRAPLAVKYFFDFLDCQADNMKIPDPDVLHIWKTNRWGTILLVLLKKKKKTF